MRAVPVLDLVNYGIWKPRMRTYIKSLDARAWTAVLMGYEHPTMVVDGDVVPKPEIDWNLDERTVAHYNDRALNALFAAVDCKRHTVAKLISRYKTAKEVWDFLESNCEGNSNVKSTRYRPQML